MWTDQIETALRSDSVTRPVFGGVFPCDQLPRSLPEGKRLFVANTDPAGKSGQHWVAFYFHPEGGCTYFDSYGLEPVKEEFIDFMEEHATYWTWNSKRLQHPRSTLCGHYCIFFGVHICRGATMEKIASMFDVNKRFNDIMVADFVEHYFDIGATPPTTSMSCSQTCCSGMENFNYV